jgi:hypothetical protein
MDIWKKGTITTNPYRETAFQALGISTGVVSRAELGRKLEERRQAVRNVPGHFRLGSRPLTQTDITNAREILFDPTRRILEELLEHRPEKPQVEDIEQFREHLDKQNWPEEFPMEQGLFFLAPLIIDIAVELMESLTPVDVPPPSLDVTLIQPFGRPGPKGGKQWQ